MSTFFLLPVLLQPCQGGSRCLSLGLQMCIPLLEVVHTHFHLPLGFIKLLAGVELNSRLGLHGWHWCVNLMALAGGKRAMHCGPVQK